MIRALCLIGGLAGAGTLSQAPEFSQQYLQRLAGQVDALTQVVMEFDQTALADGMGREEMLQAMAATPLVAPQAEMWRGTFARHARLSDNLAALRSAGPLERLTMPHRFSDAGVLQGTLADYSPAMPLSTAGAAAAGAGFLGGWALLAAMIGVIGWPFRRRQRQPEAQPKRRAPVVKGEPPVTRPRLVVASNRPQLDGVRRHAGG